MKKYIKNDSLKTIRQNWPGNLIVDGQFSNSEGVFKPSLLNVLKWKLTVNPQREEKKNDSWRPSVLEGEDFLNEKKDMIVWLGHATFFFRIKGHTFITDPVFYNLPFLKRKVPFPYNPEKIKNLDYILLSHGHMDHCDKDSLKLLCKNNSPEIFTALKMRGLISPWVSKAKVQEAGWYQQYNLSEDLKVFFLPVHHWYKRTPFDDNKILWGSFIIQTSDATVYFGGDSSYDIHFKEIEKLFPSIDIAILGVGAYSPSFMMNQSHMNPEEAVAAFHDLKAKVLIPMHYGTFDLSDEPISEPVRWLKKLEAENKIEGQLKITSVGEIFYL